MQPAIKKARVRASNPKTRTGCRTCKARHVKCDEEKPSCRRCRSAGRVCAGYASTEPDRRQPYALLLPKPGQVIKQIASNASTGIDDWDSMNLEFFYTYTAKDLPGSDLGLPWSNIILATASEPTINRAVSALGCLHRSLTGSSSPGSEGFAAPFEQYHQAIVALRKYIDRTPEVGLDVARETTLTATLLLFCFEILSGHDELAMKHLSASFGILTKAHENQLPYGSRGDGTLTLTSDQATTTNALTQVYLRLASDWLVSGALHYDNGSWPLQAVCKSTMPTHFQSKGDASIHLDAIYSEVMQYDDEVIRHAMQRHESEESANGESIHECAKMCWIFAASRREFGDQDPSMHDKVEKTLINLQRWRMAFSPLMEANPQSKPLMLLEVQFLQAWFMLRELRDYKQALCDGLLMEFEHVINIAERCIHQQNAVPRNGDDTDRSLPNLSRLGNNLASCVTYVIEKCRDSNTRRRGIQVLSSIDMRGTFDMPYLVAYYQHLVHLEETRARVLNPAATGAFTCHDFPVKARFKEVMFCDCEEIEGGDEFYKLNRGRLMYAAENDFGILELGESWFDIPREGVAGSSQMWK
ncbi:hypothetical protein Q7P37_002460 [Cladosporium fusiforme]